MRCEKKLSIKALIITIASARHADSGANHWQHVMVRMGRVLESLVAVNDEASHVFLLFPGLSKRL
nr:hypothetical protein [Paenibacillus terrae]